MNGRVLRMKLYIRSLDSMPLGTAGRRVYQEEEKEEEEERESYSKLARTPRPLYDP